METEIVLTPMPPSQDNGKGAYYVWFLIDGEASVMNCDGIQIGMSKEQAEFFAYEFDGWIEQEKIHHDKGGDSTD